MDLFNSIDDLVGGRPIFKVCDDCITVAYDNGIQSYDDQVVTMLDAGDVLEDHLCVAREEPELNIQCDCNCRIVHG